MTARELTPLDRSILDALRVQPQFVCDLAKTLGWRSSHYVKVAVQRLAHEHMIHPDRKGRWTVA